MDTLRLIWAASPLWTLAWDVLLALQGLLTVAMVYASGALADEVSLLLGSRD